MRIKKAHYSDQIFSFMNTMFLFLLLVIVLYPLIYIVSNSFSDPKAVATGKVWLWPVNFSLVGYQKVFEYKSIWRGYGNTVFYTIVGTFINILLTICAAYPLSRKDFKGRNALMFIFAFTMIFSGGMIPTYILVSNLGMLNTRWALLIPNALAVWNVIITRTYYQSSLPDEFFEAAQIDGCSNIRFIIYVVLPLSKAITAVNFLFYAVGHWNSFFNAFIYTHNPKIQPLQIVLRNILIINAFDWSSFSDVREAAYKQYLQSLMKYSLIIVASVPVLIAYPFIQKYFVKGVMIGGIKA